ncbi:MAG: carboxylesterase family protein [Acidimicrobiales bacterium]|jgi:para-nitrobenzyl esterase
MTPTVEVATGRLQGLSARAGRSKRTVLAFHGIPYAADPVGPLRFRAPQPPEPWGGVRDATEFGPASMQSGASPFSGTIPGNHVAAVSERCLTLDVWAPDQAGGLPVLVWVSGGAFLTGGTGIETYDGSGLAADEGVVVVEVNYRLGVLGFGWFGGLGRDGGGAVESWAGDTNCGLRDQLAALSWVRDNIAAFGGDPTNVTVFGESAGAGSLAHLLASPASAGLARRCILQSPGIDHTLYPDDVERVADAVLRRLSIPRSKTELLWDVGAEDLVAAQEAVVLEMMTVLTSMPFHPFVDGDLVPSSPSTAMAGGAAARMDLMVSWTTDEMRLYPNPAADAVGHDGLARWAQRYLAGRLGSDPGPERARHLVDFYRDLLGAQGRTNGSDLWAALQTDGVMRLPARRVADSHAANGGLTYVAQFAWRGPAVAGQWDPGAFHAIDLPFTFDTLERCGWRQFLRAGPDADELARQHRHAWATFGRHGRPDVPEVGSWPCYTAPQRRTLVLDTPCSLADDPLADIAEAWDGLWSTQCRAPFLG